MEEIIKKRTSKEGTRMYAFALTDKVIHDYVTCCLLTNKKRAELFTYILNEWIEKNDIRPSLDWLQGKRKEQPEQASPMISFKGSRRCIIEDDDCEGCS